MTREQIEKRILSLEDAASHYAGSDAGNGFAQDLDAYRLALAHLDSERARRVGEAVIAWVSRNGGAEYLETHSINAAGSSFAVARLIDGIKEALRGEP